MTSPAKSLFTGKSMSVTPRPHHNQTVVGGTAGQNREVTLLRQEVTKVEGQLSREKNHSTSLEAKVRDLQATIADHEQARAAANRLKVQQADENSKKSKLEEKNRELSKENSTLQADLREERARFEETVANANNSIATWRRAHEDLTAERAELEAESERKAARVAQLLKELEEVKGSLDALRDDLLTTNQERDTTKNTVSSLENKLALANVQHQEEKMSLSATINGHKQEIENLQNELSSIRQSSRTKDSEIAQLKDAATAMQGKNDRSEQAKNDVQAQYEAMVSKAEDLQLEVELHMKNHQSAKQQLELNEHQIGTLSSTSSELQNRVTDLEKELTTKDEVLSTANKDHKDLLVEHHKLWEELRQSKSNEETTQKELSETKEHLVESEKQLSALQKTMTAQEGEQLHQAAKLSSKNATLEATVLKLRHDLETEQRKVSSLETQLRTQQESVTVATTQITSFKTAMDEVNEQSAQRLKQFHESEGRLAEQVALTTKKGEECEALQTQLAAQKTAQATLEVEHSNELSALRSTVADLQSEALAKEGNVASLSGELADRNAQLKEATNTLEMLKAHLANKTTSADLEQQRKEELVAELTESRKREESTLADLQKQRDAFEKSEQEKFFIKDQFTEATKEIAGLKFEMDRTKQQTSSQVGESEKIAIELRHETEGLQVKLEEITASLASTESAYRVLQDESKKEKEELAFMQGKFAGVEKQLEEATAKFQQLVQANQELQTAVAQERENASKGENEAMVKESQWKGRFEEMESDHTRETNKLKHRLSCLENDNDSLRFEVERLQNREGKATAELEDRLKAAQASMESAKKRKEEYKVAYEQVKERLNTSVDNHTADKERHSRFVARARKDRDHLHEKFGELKQMYDSLKTKYTAKTKGSLSAGRSADANNFNALCDGVQCSLATMEDLEKENNPTRSCLKARFE